jgi:hypothetical protein
MTRPEETAITLSVVVVALTVSPTYLQTPIPSVVLRYPAQAMTLDVPEGANGPRTGQRGSGFARTALMESDGAEVLSTQLPSVSDLLSGVGVTAVNDSECESGD